jgi:dTMP kinase
LKKGKVVICDRFQDSTVVYQGYAGGLDLAMLDRLGRIATGGLAPRLTIVLDIETKLGLKRAGLKDRMEKKSFAFHKKVRAGYLKLAAKQPARIKVVKVKASIENTQGRIRKILDRHVF